MPVTKLNKYISSYGDGIHGTPSYDTNGSYYFINGNNLENGRIVIDKNTLRISEEEYERIKRPLSERTVLLSINGTLGKTAFYCNEPIALGKSVCFINVKEDYSKEFFRYILTTQEFQKYMLQVAHGSTIKNFAPGQVGEFSMNLPEENDQFKIATVLSLIDNKIEHNNNLSTTLSSLAKTIYDYWFVQFDFPDKNGKPYKSSGGKMVWNEELKRPIPKGWEVKRMGNLISYNRGVSYTGKDLEDSGVPIISLASIDRAGRYIPDGIKYYNKDYPRSKVLRPYDLIMANTDMTQERAVMGKIIFVPDIFDGDILSTHHITTLSIIDDLKAYLMMTTQTEWFHSYIKGFSSGTNVLGMDMIGFEDYLMIVPDGNTLNKFNKIIYKTYEIIFKNYKENDKLASLRDFLLPMLMNGQLKVVS